MVWTCLEITDIQERESKGGREDGASGYRDTERIGQEIRLIASQESHQHNSKKARMNELFLDSPKS